MANYVITEDEFRDIVLDDLDEIKARLRGLATFFALLLFAAIVWLYRGEVARFFSELPGVGDG